MWYFWFSEALEGRSTCLWLSIHDSVMSRSVAIPSPYKYKGVTYCRLSFTQIVQLCIDTHACNDRAAWLTLRGTDELVVSWRDYWKALERIEIELSGMFFMPSRMMTSYLVRLGTSVVMFLPSGASTCNSYYLIVSSIGRFLCIPSVAETSRCLCADTWQKTCPIHVPCHWPLSHPRPQTQKSGSSSRDTRCM